MQGRVQGSALPAPRAPGRASGTPRRASETGTASCPTPFVVISITSTTTNNNNNNNDNNDNNNNNKERRRRMIVVSMPQAPLEAHGRRVRAGDTGPESLTLNRF